MADETPAAETTAPETTTPEPKATEKAVETPAHEQLPDDHPVVKALKKANEEAAAARVKVKEFEDAQKDDITRLSDNLAAEKDRADKAEAATARLQAAIDHGLTGDDLELLGTGTPDEIDARAKRLAERIGANQGPRRPNPDPNQGNRDKNPSGSPADDFAAALGGLL